MTVKQQLIFYDDDDVDGEEDRHELCWPDYADDDPHTT